MTFLEIFLTVLMAVLIAVLFYYVFKSPGPWNSFWTYLIILILSGLAAHAWLTPVGPVAFGIAWIPVFFAIVIVALLLGAASPTRERRQPTGKHGELPEKEKTTLALGAFFWILLVFLLGVIIWSFVGGHPLSY